MVSNHLCCGLNASLVLWSSRVQGHQVKPGGHLETWNIQLGFANSFIYTLIPELRVTAILLAVGQTTFT
jgi:hypothetical protein